MTDPRRAGLADAWEHGRRDYGETGLLLEFQDTVTALAVRAALDREPLAGQRQAAAGARTVLVEFADTASRNAARTVVDRYRVGSSVAGSDAAPAAPLLVPVRYDGADLTEVAHWLGMSEQALIDRHTGVDHLVAFIGFAPGFGYLIPDGGPGWGAVPRRDTARTVVPTGSLGLAGPYSGVYPRTSPGGWQLIGRTELPIWDLARQPPALLTPGRRVRFRAVRTFTDLRGESAAMSASARSATVSTGSTGAGPEPTAPREPGIQILRTGILATAQDLGRPGLSALGVSGSGAADRPAAVRANALAGNRAGAPVVETTLGRFRFRVSGALTLALTGAPTTLTCLNEPEESADPRAEPAREWRVDAEPGQIWEVGRPMTGLRNYLAVAGGWSFPVVLGSSATDLLSGIGPSALRAEDFVSVTGIAEKGATWSAGWSRDAAPDALAPPGRSLVSDPAFSKGLTPLWVLPGPREDWITDWEEIGKRIFTVTVNSNRVGLRLSADRALVRRITGELPTEPMLPGAVQIPPDGQPVVFLTDCPVTGGYPVIAVLTAESLAVAAQLRPGDSVRFEFANVS